MWVNELQSPYIKIWIVTSVVALAWTVAALLVHLVYSFILLRDFTIVGPSNKAMLAVVETRWAQAEFRWNVTRWAARVGLYTVLLCLAAAVVNASVKAYLISSKLLGEANWKLQLGEAWIFLIQTFWIFAVAVVARAILGGLASLIKIRAANSIAISRAMPDADQIRKMKELLASLDVHEESS